MVLSIKRKAIKDFHLVSKIILKYFHAPEHAVIAHLWMRPPEVIVKEERPGEKDAEIQPRL